MRRLLFFSLLCVFVSCSSLRAELLGSTEGVESLGSYEGSISYASSDSNNAVLTVELTNTSPASNGGYLTAFAFNNPQNQISSLSLVTSDPDFSLLNSSVVDNGITAGPYGHFDLGASTGSSFQGGGAPSKGIGVGQDVTFTFTLQGTGLDGLSVLSFFSEPSQPPAIGEGPKAFVARFRGFDDGGSDKVPATFDNPEPSTFLLGSLGILTLTLRRRSRR